MCFNIGFTVFASLVTRAEQIKRRRFGKCLVLEIYLVVKAFF